MASSKPIPAIPSIVLTGSLFSNQRRNIAFLSWFTAPYGPAVNAARREPEATIILAHGGTGWGAHINEWNDTVEALRDVPNLYLETCTSIVCSGFIEFAVSELGADRIVFGTDSPLLDPAVQMAKITGAEIGEDAKRKILGGNMRRILRI